MRAWSAIFVSITSVFLAGIVRYLMRDTLLIDNPLFLFFPAVIISTLYGGQIYGLLTMLLSVVASELSFGNMAFGNMADWSRLLEGKTLFATTIFLVDSLLIILVCAAFHRSRSKEREALRKVRKSEKELHASEAKFRRMFESNMIGLVFTELEGKIIDANDYFLNLVGYRREEFQATGLNWRALTASQIDRSNEAVAELKNLGRIQPFEKEYRRKDSTTVLCLVGSATYDEKTAVTFVLDIGERKQAERALAESHEALEARVESRTTELSNANAELQRLLNEIGRQRDELRRSRSFLDSIVENIPNMIFIKDADELRFVQFNRAGEELLGFSRADLIGKNDYDFFPKDQADFFTAKDRMVLSRNRVVDIAEEPLDTKYGVKWLHTKKIPLLDQDGLPQYLLGISEDITEKKALEAQRLSLAQAEAARIEAERSAQRLAFLSKVSEKLYQTFDMKAMISGFAALVSEELADLCCVEIGRNAAAEQVDSFQAEPRGPGRDSIEAAFVLSAKDPELQNRLQSARNAAVQRPILKQSKSASAILYTTASSHSADLLLSNREDDTAFAAYLRELPCGSVLSAPLEQYGELVGMIVLIRIGSGEPYRDLDVSLARELARRLSDAIANAQLFQQAQQANRVKSAFLANMSHEIRTPLSAVLGFTELMAASSTLSVEHASYLETISKNGLSLLRIVDEILDLSKVESDRIQIEQLAFPLDRLIREVVALLSVKANEKNLEFSVHPRKDLPEMILSDPNRLRQILINIIGNAIKFTERGSIEIEIDWRTEGAGDRSGILQFQVKDSGIGIAKESITSLFKPFVQADDSMTRRFGGTGLGLFLSRKLARLMGGDLSLEESRLGEGSCFVLRIPTQIAPLSKAPEAPANPNSQELSRQGAWKKLQRGRILVVDDSQDNRLLLSLILERLGYESDLATNGFEALSKARESSYEAVLMDIQMPELDGIQAMKRLRAEGYLRLPIIALTAHAMKGDRERFLQTGFDDYLCKPIDRDTLELALDKAASGEA